MKYLNSLTTWIKSHKKASIAIIIIISLVVTLAYFLIAEANEEKRHKQITDKLLGVWINQENGSTFNLHEFGLCMASPKVDGEFVTALTCKYEIIGNIIRFEVEGEKEPWEMMFNDDITELITPSGMIYKREYKENNENTEDEEEYKRFFNKQFILTGSTDGKKATIKFLKNKKCEIDMSPLSRIVNIGPKSKPSYINVKYNNDGVCTYTMKDDLNIVVHYTGTYNITVPQVPQLSQSNIYVFQTPIQEMEITFNENYDAFKITNGIFKMANYAIYFTDLIDTDKNNNEDDLEEIDNNSSSSSNSSNNPNNNNSNNNSNSNSSSSNNSSGNANNNNFDNNSSSDDNQNEYTPVWHEWSAWDTTPITASDTREVETRKVNKEVVKPIYKYKHYICNTPAYLTPNGNSTPYESDCKDGYWEYTESEYSFKFGTGRGTCNYYYGGYYDYKKYKEPNPKEACWFEDGIREEKETIEVTEYRYREKY